MEVSRREFTGNLAALVASFVVPARMPNFSNLNQPQGTSPKTYKLKLFVYGAKEPYLLEGTADELRNRFIDDRFGGRIPDLSHLDNVVYAIAATLSSDYLYLASKFDLMGLGYGRSNERNDISFIHSVEFSPRTTIILKMAGLLKEEGQLEITRLTGYEINDGYLDNDNYGALRRVVPGAEEWRLAKPIVDGPRIFAEAQLASAEGDHDFDFIELDITGASGLLIQALKFQTVFLDKDLKLVMPQYDKEGKLLPPYGM